MSHHLKKIFILWFYPLLFTGFTAYTQPVTKGIYLVNAISKIPVQGALVMSEHRDFTILSDENGFINLNQLPASATQLIITSVGFETTTIQVATLIDSQMHSVISLIPKVATLEEVKVIATANGGIFKTISELDVHLRPINNSQEVLRIVPGLFIGQHAGGGKAEQLFLRGFDLDHGTDIHISVDGMPVNMVSHAHGQGYADLHFVIPELIDKVNRDKGPYFADKGNFTTAGYVEFKTKEYLAHNFIKLEGGQFQTFRTVAGINLIKPRGNRRNQSLYVAGEAFYTHGYFDNPQDLTRFNGVLKYHGNISNYSTLAVAVTGFTSKWNASGQIPNRAVASGLIDFYGTIDSTEGGHTSRCNANVVLLTNLKNGGSIHNQLYYSQYAFKLYSNFTFFKIDTVNGDQIRQREKRNIYGYNGAYRRSFFIGNMKTETNAGIQWRYDDINNIELSRTKDRAFTTARLMYGDINEMNAGVYWAQSFNLFHNLELTGGIRADYFINQYNDKLLYYERTTQLKILCPKLNFSYRLNDHVQLYLYNGKGFHSNDTRVVVQENGTQVLPAAYGSDAGGIFKIGSKMILQSALWYLWLKQEFIYVGDEGIVEAGGQTRRTGVDCSVRYEFVKNLFADVDISVANPRAIDVVKSDSYLPLAPRFTSVGGFTYRKEQGWNGSIRYRYMANRPANEDNTVVAKGYFIADAAVNYTGQKWEAGLSVQNVFNTKWKETQFDTESRLQNESAPVSEIHFTAGTPFFAKVNCTVFF